MPFYHVRTVSFLMRRVLYTANRTLWFCRQRGPPFAVLLTEQDAVLLLAALWFKRIQTRPGGCCRTRNTPPPQRCGDHSSWAACAEPKTAALPVRAPYYALAVAKDDAAAGGPAGRTGSWHWDHGRGAPCGDNYGVTKITVFGNQTPGHGDDLHM